MGWPEVAMITLQTSNLAFAAFGYVKTGDLKNLFCTAVGTAIVTGLLYAGGFFS